LESTISAPDAYHVWRTGIEKTKHAREVMELMKRIFTVVNRKPIFSNGTFFFYL
jgi:hypothetical protein